MFTCPVCFYPEMTEPPKDYNICECCGTEFANDDEECSHAELRADWLRAGARWFFGEPPIGWNGWKQAQVLTISSPQPQYKIMIADSSPMYSTILSSYAQIKIGSYVRANGAVDIFPERAEMLYASPQPRRLCA